jgi:sporulation protein YtfJ
VAEHPIEEIMKTTMENIKEMIDVNTIVGDAVETADGTVIIPISKVSFGFVAGGGEYKNNMQDKNANITQQEANKLPFAGGSGAGISLNPIAFLVVGQEKIKLLPVNFTTPIDRVVELIPQLVEEIRGKKKQGNESQNINNTQQPANQ